jgi:hypothetical protein
LCQNSKAARWDDLIDPWLTYNTLLRNVAGLGLAAAVVAGTMAATGAGNVGRPLPLGLAQRLRLSVIDQG